MTKTRTRAAIALALVCPFVTTAIAGATTVVADDAETLARDADVVVRGLVVDQRVERDPAGRIITWTALEVLEAFKGAALGETLTIYQVGGHLEGETLQIDGDHRWRFGDEVVFFASRGPWPGTVVSVGIGVGRFVVLREPSGARVVEDRGDVIALAPEERGGQLRLGVAPRPWSSLDALRAEIADGLARPAARGRVLRPIVKRARVLRGGGR